MGRVWDAQYIRDQRYLWWRYTKMHIEIDKAVAPFLELNDTGQWLKRMRSALLYSVRTIANRAELSISSYHRYEKEEAAGTITLKALKKCADALDCDLIYGLRPKAKKFPSDVIWDQIFPHVKHHSWCHLHTLMNDKLYNPEFRKEMGWVRNTRAQADSEVIRSHQIDLRMRR